MGALLSLPSVQPMKETPTVRQIVLFGDFAAVVPDAETIRYFMDEFRDLELVPTVLQTPPPATGGGISFSFGPASIHKFIFASSGGGLWSIAFAEDRIDITQSKAVLEGPDVMNIGEFTARGLRAAGSILTRYPAFLFRRMSLVTRNVHTELTHEEFQQYYRRHFVGTEFYNENPPRDWRTRVSARWPIPNLDGEEANVITALSKAMAVVSASAKPEQRTVPAIDQVIDINTAEERVNPRFDLTALTTFINDSVALEARISDEIS